MNKLVRLGPLVSLLAAFTAQLAGCDSAEDATCATTGCPAGQACSNGACVPGQGQAGSTGATSSVGGGSAAGSGTGGGVGSAGTVSNGGAAAGSSSGGGQAGSGSAGSNAQGGMSGNNGGSAQGGSAQGGSAQGGGGMAQDMNVVGQCKDDFWPAANNGSVTRYDFSQGTSLPACTYVITHTGKGSDGDWDTVEGISTGDGGYFGAMNTEDYNNGAACGACVEASYNGRKVVLTIVDECPLGGPHPNPKCTKGHIDLSRKAIRQLEPNGSQEDLHGVNWHYIKCPANGNVKARLHPNQNPNWQPVVIENGLFPLKSVTLNGAEAKRAGNTTGGNAWVADGKKTPYTVRATDVNNATITFMYNGDGGLKDVGSQFMCK